MSQEAREWLGLLVAVFAVMSFLSLLIWIQASDRGRERARIVKTLGLVWGAIAVSVASGWLLCLRLGGPVFEVSSVGGLRLLVRSLSGGQAALLCGLLAGLVGLYVVAILAVRRLLGPAEPAADEVPAEPSIRGEEQ